MYSTDVGELAYKVQIYEGYRYWNKNDASRQILDYYGRVNAVSMRRLTLRALQAEAIDQEELSGDAEHRFLDETDWYRPRKGLAQAEDARPRKSLKTHYANIDNLRQLLLSLDVSVERIFEEMIKYSRRSLKGDERLPEDDERLSILPIKQFGQLQILVLTFQETDVYDTHRAGPPARGRSGTLQV